MLVHLGGSNPSWQEGPSFLFRVRAEARWTEIRGPEGQERVWGFWEGQPASLPAEGSGEHCKLPQGCLEKSPVAKRFSCILEASDARRPLLDLIGGQVRGACLKSACDMNWTPVWTVVLEYTCRERTRSYSPGARFSTVIKMILRSSEVFNNFFASLSYHLRRTGEFLWFF